MVPKRNYIDLDGYAKALRQKCIVGKDNFLITNLSGSLEEKDLTLGTNCQGFGRIHHFGNQTDEEWIPNPLPHQVASWRLGLPADSTKTAQVFQTASCNMRCWYCFVDFDLLSALESKSAFKTTDELLDLFLLESDKPRIIDLSGGQPDIIPEWPVRMMESLLRRKLENDYFLWIDDNLSLYYAWEYLTSRDFDLMRRYRNFARVGCFKGYSPQSFHENTMGDPKLFLRQVDILSKWSKLGIDTYGYITLTSSDVGGMRKDLHSFMNSIQKQIGHYFLLRVIPLKIIEFTPTAQRMNDQRRRAIANQQEAMGAWIEELESRYSKKERALPIYEVPQS